jgi:hypothetical protein
VLRGVDLVHVELFCLYGASKSLVLVSNSCVVCECVSEHVYVVYVGD